MVCARGSDQLDQLDDVPLFARFRDEATEEHPQLLGQGMQRRCLHESIRRMLSAQVYDVMDATREAINEYRPTDVESVRALPVLVRFSPLMREQSLGAQAVFVSLPVPSPAGDGDDWKCASRLCEICLPFTCRQSG